MDNRIGGSHCLQSPSQLFLFPPSSLALPCLHRQAPCIVRHVLRHSAPRLDGSVSFPPAIPTLLDGPGCPQTHSEVHIREHLEGCSQDPQHPNIPAHFPGVKLDELLHHFSLVPRQNMHLLGHQGIEGIVDDRDVFDPGQPDGHTAALDQEAGEHDHGTTKRNKDRKPGEKR